MKKASFLPLLGLAALAVGGASEAPPADEKAATKPVPRALQGKVVGEPVNCVATQNIQRTETVGDQVILFHMRGGQVYRNDLPHRCPGLRMNNPFRYTSSIPQLCSVDIITPFDTSTGMDYGSCGLGQFQPYELPKKGD